MRNRIQWICLLAAAVFCLAGCADVSIREDPAGGGILANVRSADPEHPVRLAVTVDGQKLVPEQPEQEAALPDGTYLARFDTDSSMFHVNEASDGRGILTVQDGEMMIHVSLQSKKIVQLFCGSADDAKKEGASLLEPTLDTVTYPDGISEEVYGFDIPVPSLDEPFPVALVGTKGKWYDHSVTVSDPIPFE